MGRHLRGYGHQLSIAADDEGDGLARRGIVQHAAKLVLTLDGLAVHLQDDVVPAQTCLAGRSVMIYQNDLAATSLFQLERAELVGGYVTAMALQPALPTARRRPRAEIGR